MSLPTDATFRALVSVLNEVNSNLELHLKLVCLDHNVTIQQLREYDPSEIEEAAAEIQTEEELDHQVAMEQAAIEAGYEVTDETDFDDRSWLEELGEVSDKAKAQAKTTIKGPGYGG